MTEAMQTAIGTAFSNVQTDVMAVLGTALPIAIAIAGVVWVCRKAFRWFKGMT